MRAMSLPCILSAFFVYVYADFENTFLKKIQNYFFGTWKNLFLYSEKSLCYNEKRDVKIF